jgi:hypothetical protein
MLELHATGQHPVKWRNVVLAVLNIRSLIYPYQQTAVNQGWPITALLHGPVT